MFQRAAPSPTRSRQLWSQLAIGTNWPILAAVALLSTIGLITIWNDTGKDGIIHQGPTHLAYIIIGIICMTAFQAVNYQIIGRWAWTFYAIAFSMVVYTVIGGKVHLPFVPIINGAHKWIVVGPASHPVSMEPAELMKVGFIMVLARYLRFRSNYRTFSGLIAPLALALVPVVLILRQPDLGTSFCFIPALFAMLFVAGAKLHHLLMVVLIGLVLAPVAWLSGKDPKTHVPHSRLRILQVLPELVSGHQRQCVLDIFHDDSHTNEHGGFQQYHALMAFGSGGVVGKGIGKMEIGRRVPESDNDMVFALIGEQFGLFGATVVLLAYLTLFVAGTEVAAATREPFGRLVALGVVAMLAAQTFSNLMVAVRLMPVTGVPLPFISTGGSSIVASFMSAGLLLNIGQNRPIVMAKDSFEFD